MRTGVVQLGPGPKRFQWEQPPGRLLCTQSEFHSGPGPLCLALAASSTFPCSCALPLQWISLSPANILPLGFRRFRLMMQMMMKAPQVTLTGVAIALSPFLGPFPYLWPYPFFVFFTGRAGADCLVEGFLGSSCLPLQFRSFQEILVWHQCRLGGMPCVPRRRGAGTGRLRRDLPRRLLAPARREYKICKFCKILAGSFSALSKRNFARKICV